MAWKNTCGRPVRSAHPWRAVGVVPSGGGWIELAPNGALVAGKIADTAVLGAERVSKERDGHGVRRR